MESIATLVAYASSAFVFIPAGRDIVSWETPLLPGEENVRPMMHMTGEKVRFWMWGMWGYNHCLISLIKLIAIMNGDKSQLKLLALSSVPLGYFCYVGQMEHGDMEGFVALCAAQFLSLGYLGFVAAPSEKTKTK